MKERMPNEPDAESPRDPSPRRYPRGPAVESVTPGQVDIRRLLRVLREKWVVIAACVAMAAILAGLYILVAHKTYAATALVELSVRRPRIAGQQAAVIDDSGGAGQSEEIFNTWLERFKSRTMLDMSVARLRQTADTKKMSDESLRKLMQRRSSIVLIRRSRLVQISFEYTDPKFASAGANAFADAAAAMAFEENKAAAENAVTWLQEQGHAERESLEKADQALVEFRAKNKVDVLVSQKKSVEESLLAFNKTLVDVQSQEVLARELFNTLSSLDLKPENAGKLPAAIPRAIEVQAVLDKWRAAIAERDTLLTKYTDKHPEVIAQGKVIEAARVQALEAIRRAKETATSDLDLLHKQVESLQKAIAEQRKQESDLELQIVDITSRLNTLEHAREAADISYKGLLNRIEEARLSADENTAIVKIVERATEPERPVRPRKSVVLLVWLLLGLVGGMGLALLTDTLEDYITSPEDIETGVGMNILALIPHQDTARRDELAVASLNDKFGQFAEAYAGVRAMLDSSKYSGASRSILIASTAPDEGKTVTACNLAIVSAKSGKRTLLIDFDMRRPHLDHVFRMPAEAQSLMQVLDAKDPSVFSKLPFKTECDGLHIIASRVSGDLSPAEIIGGKFVREFMKWAVSTYDRVVVDAPPFSVVSDAVVLADMVDCALLVCRQNQSRKRAMRRTLEYLQHTETTVIGVIMNDVVFTRGFYAGDNENYYGHYNYHKYFKQKPGQHARG